jgi:hypothetical protein
MALWGKASIVVAALATAVVLGGASFGGIAAADYEGPVIVTNGNTRVAFDGSVAPSELPTDRFSPAMLSFGFSVSTAEGSPPSVARRLLIDTDLHLRFDFKSIPTCDPSTIKNSPVRNLACREGIVGGGAVNFQPAALARRSPMPLPSYALLYNGGLIHGIRRLWLRHDAYVSGVLTRLVSPVDIKAMRDGPFGRRIALSFSSLPEGIGSLSILSLNLREGVAGSCRTRSIKLRATAVLADGSRPTVGLHRPCKPQPPA